MLYLNSIAGSKGPVLIYAKTTGRAKRCRPRHEPDVEDVEIDDYDELINIITEGLPASSPSSFKIYANYDAFSSTSSDACILFPLTKL